MIYKNFKDLKLSALGFGTMRLPTLADSSIDEAPPVRMRASRRGRSGGFKDCLKSK